MKTYLSFAAAITAGALLSGCASNRNSITLAPVGPSSDPTTSHSGNGTLVVYSAFKRNADFNSRDYYRPEYSDYKILSTDGSLLRKVHNNSGNTFQDAVAVSLTPGRYNVVARANSYGFVTVPVIVTADHSTVLHLEGGGNWPDASAFNQDNSVRLPDGQIVGWKAGQ